MGSAGSISSGFGIFNGSLYYFLQLRQRKFERVCSESIGIYHVAACIKIIPMDFSYNIRMGKIPSLRKFSGCHSGTLEQSPHTAVKAQDVFFHKI